MTGQLEFEQYHLMEKKVLKDKRPKTTPTKA
jgi:hypothetical protein